MVTYDAGLLEGYADALYREARWVAIRTAFFYGSVLWFVFFILLFGVAAVRVALGGPQAPPDFSAMAEVACLPGVIGLAVGTYVGVRRAFQLKLEAQRLLCQVQIERNTAALVEGKAKATYG